MHYRKILIAILIFIFFFSYIPLIEISASPPEQPITVIFRYDDYSSLSPTEMEIKIINAFQNSNIPVTFGVIPYICKDNSKPMPLTLIKAEILKNVIDAGILEAADGMETFNKLCDYLSQYKTAFAKDSADFYNTK